MSSLTDELAYDGEPESTSMGSVPRRLIRDLDQISEDNRRSRNAVVATMLRWCWREGVDLTTVKLDAGPTENLPIRVGSLLLDQARLRRGAHWNTSDVVMRALTIARDHYMANAPPPPRKQ